MKNVHTPWRTRDSGANPSLEKNTSNDNSPWLHSTKFCTAQSERHQNRKEPNKRWPTDRRPVFPGWLFQLSSLFVQGPPAATDCGCYDVHTTLPRTVRVLGGEVDQARRCGTDCNSKMPWRRCFWCVRFENRASARCNELKDKNSKLQQICFLMYQRGASRWVLFQAKGGSESPTHLLKSLSYLVWLPENKSLGCQPARGIKIPILRTRENFDFVRMQYQNGYSLVW